MTTAVLFDARTMWYVTRATGVVSLVLLTASVVLGVTEAVRWASARWPRFVTAGVHKNVSLLATTFIAAHIFTAVVDGFAPIGWLDTVVPFHSPYRPLWLGLGTVAFDLLIALTVTSILRPRISPRLWRFVHWGAYACWPVALVHGLGTGTDTKTSWAFGLELTCMAVVVVAVWWRISAGWPAHQGQRALAAAVSALTPLLIAIWVFSGPLQPGWARRAGTPSSLLGPSVPAAATGDAAADPVSDTTPAAATLTPPFDASLDGTVDDPGPDRRGNDTITIDAKLDNGARGALHIVIQGRAVDDGGVTMEQSTVTLTSASGADTFTGSIGTLRGTVMTIDLQSTAGAALTLELNLDLNGATVTGTAHGS